MTAGDQGKRRDLLQEDASLTLLVGAALLLTAASAIALGFGFAAPDARFLELGLAVGVVAAAVLGLAELRHRHLAKKGPGRAGRGPRLDSPHVLGEGGNSLTAQARSFLRRVDVQGVGRSRASEFWKHPPTPRAGRQATPDRAPTVAAWFDRRRGAKASPGRPRGFLRKSATARRKPPTPNPKRLRQLLRYAAPRWKGLVVVGVAMTLAVGFQLAKPWAMKILVDNVLRPGGPDGNVPDLVEALPGAPTPDTLLLWVVVGTIVVFLGATVSSMVQTIVSVRVGQRMTYDLGSDLFMHLQKMSLVFHSRRPVGDSTARVTTDPYCVQSLVTGALLPMLQAGITIVAMFFIMWNLDPVLTLLSIAVVPFLLAAIRFFKEPMKQRSRVTADLEGGLMSIVQQTLSSIPVVQAFNREHKEHARFRNHADMTVEAYVRSTQTDLWFKLAAGLVTVMGTALLMWVGARSVMRGDISLGTLLVFLAYLSSLYGPLDSMTYTVSTMQNAAAKADRIMELMETPSDVTDAPDATEIEIEGHVTYRDVTFGYDPERTVLSHISLEAHPGDVVAIVGPTGAGKSTLMNLLVRFFDPQSGSIEIDGQDIRSIRLACLREQIAIVLQEPFVFPMTAADNIAYGAPNASFDDVVRAAVAANADDFIRMLPDGYDTVIGERGATLSGGEKQRLSIARAFLKDAPILILDEPTSALDANTESSLMDAMGRLMERRVSFVIAHRLSTIRRATQILVLQDGRIIERGSHANLLANNGLYATLYRTQMNVAHDGDALPQRLLDTLHDRLTRTS